MTSPPHVISSRIVSFSGGPVDFDDFFHPGHLLSFHLLPGFSFPFGYPLLLRTSSLIITPSVGYPPFLLSFSLVNPPSLLPLLYILTLCLSFSPRLSFLPGYLLPPEYPQPPTDPSYSPHVPDPTQTG